MIARRIVWACVAGELFAAWRPFKACYPAAQRELAMLDALELLSGLGDALRCGWSA